MTQKALETMVSFNLDVNNSFAVTALVCCSTLVRVPWIDQDRQYS
jgi:hypothetical protein